MKKREPTREKLLRAMEAALGEKPYDAITVGELAGRCGITRQGFYRHFPHKEALCAALSQRYVYSGLTPGGRVYMGQPDRPFFAGAGAPPGVLHGHRPGGKPPHAVPHFLFVHLAAV